jgi:hypothetical protein
VRSPGPAHGSPGLVKAHAPLDPENFQPSHWHHTSWHHYTHPSFAALRRLLHLPWIFLTCRVACSLDHTWLLSCRDRLGSSAALQLGHGGFRPFTRSNRFTPPGTLVGPGRSRATRSPPDRLGPTRGHGTGGPLGSGQPGSVPRSHPCSAQATRIPAEHTARADSDPSAQYNFKNLKTLLKL